MWVIKLGGSVSRQTSLVKWLQLVARYGDGKVIIVPGGGFYADAVRQFQRMRANLPEGHVHDKQAHALAVYAMDQMARSFVAMVPELVLVRNPLEIAERGWQHLGLVWLPSEMVLHPERWQPDGLAENWEVTSDSLATWLAAHLEAQQLLLVKSANQLETPKSHYGLAQLQAEGILDKGMTHALQLGEFGRHVMHHQQWTQFVDGFDQTKLTGALVTA